MNRNGQDADRGMWQGKKRAVTLSFDDGVTQDIRLIEMLDRYGLKATFNINSGLLGKPGQLIRTVLIQHERARFLIYDILTKYTKEQLKQFILTYQKDLLEVGLTSVQTDDFKLWDATVDDILAAYEELDA